MAVLKAERFTTLKSKVKAEVLRRNKSGSVASYGGAAYDYKIQPAKGTVILQEHLDKLSVPLSAQCRSRQDGKAGAQRGGACQHGGQGHRLVGPVHDGPQRKRLQERLHGDVLHRLRHGLYRVRLRVSLRLFGLRERVPQHLHGLRLRVPQQLLGLLGWLREWVYRLRQRMSQRLLGLLGRVRRRMYRMRIGLPQHLLQLWLQLRRRLQ